MDSPRSDATGPRAWLARHDPGLRATKRSVRAAVLLPALFAATVFGTSNGQTPLFTAFGSTALLLFVDFGGPLAVRARSYLVLWLTGAVFVVVGTACSTHAAAAVVAMAVVGFCVLFAGVVSPQAVTASTAALLLFVLPVSEVAPASAVGDRLLGWVVAGVACIPAALFVWSSRWHDPLRRSLTRAADAVADLLDAAAAGGPAPDPDAAERALRELRTQYEATPYRPTGAGPTDVALTNLVSRTEWAGSRAVAATAHEPPDGERAHVAAIESAAAEVLRSVVALLAGRDVDGAAGRADGLRRAVTRLVAAREAATDDVIASLVSASGASAAVVVDDSTDPAVALGGVDPTYPVRMLAFALEVLADGALDAVGPPPGTLGRRARAAATLRSFARVASGHLTLRSVWFRNSLRGAVGLALAVTVVELTTVQHGFWVVLGTMSVLRSNALGTGATALRAVLGTTLGFAGGYLVLLVIGHHDARLWIVLPVAVLVAGVAPTVISFTAGQAGFTVMVVVIFNIIDPVGYRVGLVRIEDVLIGAGVSMVVGLLFWPRGARAQLARALGDAYATAAAWLSSVVARVAGGSGDQDGSPEAVAALDAARRLDDAYRQYLAERGAKDVPLPVVTRLVTGTARIRLTALTLVSLPDLAVPDGPAPLEEVTAAQAAVAAECGAVEAWFDGFARALGRRPVQVPAIPPADARLAPQLVRAWDAVLRAGRRDGVIAVFRLLWTEERMVDLRELRDELASSTGPVGG